MATKRPSKTPTTGDQVFALREFLNMNQKQFCDAVGCSQGTLARLENEGPTTPKQVSFMEVAMKLEPSNETPTRGRVAVPVDSKAQELLATIKQKHGLSLAALGEKIGRSGPMVRHFLNGEMGIPEDIKSMLPKLLK